MSLNRRTLLSAATAWTSGVLIAGRPSPTVAWGDFSSAPIRVAQIGTKHSHARGKLAAVRNLPDQYAVVGVVEPDSQQRARVADTPPYSGLTFLSESEVLNDPDLPVVLVETEIADLVPTAIRCLMAGKHVHVDKPAGLSLSQCQQMHQQAQQRGLTVQMGYMLRYNPAVVRLLELLDAGTLGTIREINAAMGKLADETLRSELAQYAGGGMFELACHLIDLVVTILGPPEQVTAFNRRSREPQDRFADNQLAVLQYRDAFATVRCNHLDPLGGSRRFFEVVGDRGVFRMEPLEPARAKLGLTQPNGQLSAGWHDLTFPVPTGRYDDEFRDLARVVRGQSKLRWNAAHDLAVHETVLAACGMTSEPD